jgi:3',5'-cyclic AMP phosphodiesterase CpdA
MTHSANVSQQPKTLQQTVNRREFTYQTCLGVLGSLVLPSCVLPSGALADEQQTEQPQLQPKKLVVAHLCDPQLGFGGFDEDLARLQQAVQQVNELAPDVTVIAGDMVNDMKKEQETAAICEQIAALKSPVVLTAGNHDLPDPVTAEGLERYRRVFGDDFKTLEVKDRLLISANSQLWRKAPTEETERHDQRLNEAFQKAKDAKTPAILITHIPPFVADVDEKDSYYNIPQAKRKALLEQAEQHGVTIWLSGHLHKTLNRKHGSITILNGETTSVNFDKRPYGFRLLTVHPDHRFEWAFIPLK